MKYLIASALFILPCVCSAQYAYTKSESKTQTETRTVEISGTTSSKFKGSMGEYGTSSKTAKLTTISLCLNTRDSIAKSQNNQHDTTNYRTTISRINNITTVVHPNGSRSTITDESGLVIVKASTGEVAVFHKLNDCSNNQLASSAQYTASYNRNATEIKTTYGPAFKYEQKGNIAVIINWNGSYLVMITTGKTAVVVDSKGVETLIVHDDKWRSVMPSIGFHADIDNQNETSIIRWANGEKQTLNNYGCLSLYTTKDGQTAATFNYEKIEPNNYDGGSFTEVTVDKSALASVSR